MLKAFASFGFCKAHAAAFALPTYHSAWLKTHHPAAFLAGVLTHDPGMYPKRLILDDARSPRHRRARARRQRLDRRLPRRTPRRPRPPACRCRPSTSRPSLRRVPWGATTADPDLPDASGYGIRLSLADVRGINDGGGGPHRGRPALRRAGRLLAPRPRLPPGRRAPRPRRRVRQPLRHAGRRPPASAPGDSGAGVAPPVATCCCTSPSSTATAGRWTVPHAGRHRAGPGRRAAAGVGPDPRGWSGAGPGGGAVAGGAAGARRPTSSRPSSRSTSVTGPSSPAAPACPS